MPLRCYIANRKWQRQAKMRGAEVARPRPCADDQLFGLVAAAVSTGDTDASAIRFDGRHLVLVEESASLSHELLLQTTVVNL